MTIARRSGRSINAAVAAVAAAPRTPHAPATWHQGVPLPLGDAPAPEALAPVGRLRRCTFRRIDQVNALPTRPTLTAYEVMCLYVDRDEPLALGDIGAARPICEACMAPGIFRPDED